MESTRARSGWQTPAVVPATSLNPHAGEHPVTSLPLEVEAARRASEAALRDVPYYRERYGERGRLFGQSDGAWLATLCRSDRAYLETQVLWLGSVLSSRGMPRLLLERHLRTLHAALLDAAPDEAECYDLLLAAADTLRERRTARIAERDAAEVAAAFAAAADPAWAARLPRLGEILAAAVADEADGIENAVPSIESWAADPARFPRPWVDAVVRTLADARARVRAGA